MNKIIRPLFVFVVFVFWFSVYASNVQKTFLETLSEEKIKIESMFDQSYNIVYNMFSSSVWWFLSSLDYKWLVCLWVIDDTILLQEIQNDSKNLKIWFLNSYANIYADALDVEQKKRILQDTNVSLFPNWSDYEKEKNRILDSFNQLITGQNNLSNQFVTKYQWKINKFVADFEDYSQRNKTLLNSVSTQIQSILAIENAYKELTSDLLKYQMQLAWSWAKFFSKLNVLKKASISWLDIWFQYIIDRETRRYRILPNLEEELVQQKNYALWLYEMQFDEKTNFLLEKRYDNKEFTQITKEVQSFLTLYYPKSKMQCSLFLNSPWFLEEAASLLSKINSFNQSFSSNNTSWDIKSSQFQDAVMKRIPVVIQLQKDINKDFSDAVVQKRNHLLQLSRDKSQETDIPKQEQNVWLDISPTFKFTKPFTKWQYDSDIKILQKLLNKLWYYFDEIDGLYSVSTIQAVHKYQLSKWLLKWYEKRPETWWWMGPATRAKLNKDLLQ